MLVEPLAGTDRPHIETIALTEVVHEAEAGVHAPRGIFIPGTLRACPIPVIVFSIKNVSVPGWIMPGIVDNRT